MHNKSLITLLVLLFLVSFQGSASNQKIEEIEQKLTLGIKDGRVELLTELVWLYRNNNFDKAMEYGSEVLEALKSMPNPELEAKVLHSMGWAQMRVGHYEQAKNLSLEAKRIAEKHNLTQQQAYAVNVLGGINWFQGNFLHALDHFLHTLSLRQNLGDKKEIAASYNNIGSVYQEINEYEKALEYHLLSLELKREVKDNYGIAVSLFNISIIYRYLGELENELEYLLQANDLFLALNEKDALTEIWVNLGLLNIKLNKYELANEQFDHALKYAIELKNKSFEAKALLGSAEIRFHSKNYPEAEKRALQSLAIAENLKEKTQIRDANLLLSKIYESTNRSQRALDFYKSYIIQRDTVLSDSNEGQLSLLQERFDKNQAEIKIEILQKEKKLSELEAQKKQNENLYLLIISITGFVLVSVILFLYLRLLKKNKQTYILSITDSLCQCYNRNYLFSCLIPELVKQQSTIYSILIDIDYFKAINDTYGHAVGDSVLIEFSRRVNKLIDYDNHLVRLGGEEFVLIGTGNIQEQALSLAEQIRKAVTQQAFKTELAIELKVSCSIGVTMGQVSDDSSVIDLIKQSDQAMYLAKEQGRDRVVSKIR
jgi:diguanylate cyclase (GGDEF)-like protein